MDPIYNCVSDSFDPSGDETYTLQEFLTMCQECFGGQPELVESKPGYFYHINGDLVLVEVAR